MTLATEDREAALCLCAVTGVLAARAEPGVGWEPACFTIVSACSETEKWLDAVGGSRPLAVCPPPLLPHPCTGAARLCGVQRVCTAHAVCTIQVCSYADVRLIDTKGRYVQAPHNPWNLFELHP